MTQILLPLRFRGSILCKESGEKSRDFVKVVLRLERRTWKGREVLGLQAQADIPFSKKIMLTTHPPSIPLAARELRCIIPAEGKLRQSRITVCFGEGRKG